MNTRLALAILLPFIACIAQWLLWDAIRPYVWFLFFPAAFFSAWLGGLIGGLAATVISTLLVWYFFIPPAFSFALNNPASAFSIVIFAFMGVLFAFFFERLQRSMRRTDEALAAAEATNKKITQLLRLFTEGVQDYLNKPFSTEELLARIGGLVASRQRTMEELSRSEAALKEAQHLAGIGNWTWDIQSDTHSWSEEIYRIYGRALTLPPAIYPEVQQYFTPESWARLAAAVEKGMAEGAPYECDAEVVRPDGMRRWIVARGEATRDADGHVVKMHGTVQDITVRKHAEEEIRRLNADLERRVAERTAELTAANRELDSFAYAVSHDLRAPLRAMSGFSQALKEDYSNQLQGDARIYLEQIDLASRKMSDLIDGLLTLSRSTRGELQYDVVDLSALSRQLLIELAQGESGRQVKVEVADGLQARGDARMIEAAMRNLLGNAWKYTAHTAAPRIRVYAEERDGARRFCVTDNGAGFDMAHANRLFQAFQRLHRQDEFPGIGIGLATVQRIVHRHGGIIEAHGEPNKGATFSFTLSDMPVKAALADTEA